MIINILTAGLMMLLCVFISPLHMIIGTSALRLLCHCFPVSREVALLWKTVSDTLTVAAFHFWRAECSFHHGICLKEFVFQMQAWTAQEYSSKDTVLVRQSFDTAMKAALRDVISFTYIFLGSFIENNKISFQPNEGLVASVYYSQQSQRSCH